MTVHFVRFKDAHGPQYQSAVRVFGSPDFMHRLWDRRAQREVVAGDIIVFAEGEHDQPLSQYNGDDEYYETA